MIYRRCSKRTVYNSLTQDTLPNDPPPGTRERIDDYVVESPLPSSSTIVRIEHRDGANVLLAQEKHYYYGSPVEAYANAIYPPITYPPWASGKEFKTEFFSVNNGVAGEALRRTENTWSPNVPDPYTAANEIAPPPNPKIIETTTTLLDSNRVSKQSFVYDQYNNQTDLYEYDYGIGSPGNLARYTHTDYLKSGYDTIDGGISNPNQAATVHIRGFQVSQTVYSYSGSYTKMAETIYEYDNYAASDGFHAQPVTRPGITGMCDGSPQNCPNAPNFTGPNYTTRGNVTKVSRWLNTTGGAVNTYRQYDVAGNVIKAIDANGAATNADFTDCFGYPDDDARSNAGAPELAGGVSYAFPTKVTNALGHAAYTQYDYYLGKPVNVEDANGVVSSAAYDDALDRLTQSIQSRYKVSVGALADKRQTSFIYDDVNRVITTTGDRDSFNDNILTSKSYYDGLGRTRRTAGNEGSTWTIKDTKFDALSRVSQVSNPYRAADPDSASPPSGLWTRTSYDALDRVVDVETPDGAHVTTLYNGSQVTVVDQAGKKRRNETDALGRLIKVTEDPGGLNYDTSYSYDALSNLQSVTQGAQTRSFDYDSLSRLVRATNPESGRVTYGYDPNGNLTEKVDARQVKTTITYDELNRARSKVYTGTQEGTAVANLTPRVDYFYDGYTGLPGGAPTWSGTPSKGRLVGVTYGGGSEGTYYKYDASGAVVTNLQRQGTSNYITDYEYNLAGAVTIEHRGGKNLVRRRIWRSYDTAGRPVSMQSGAFNSNGIEPFDLVRDISYTPFGGLESETYGNGLIHSMSYNNRLQPIEIRLGGPGNPESVFRIVNIFGTADNVNGQDAEITLARNSGNIARVKFFISGLLQYSQTFQYDPVDRLRYAVEHNNGVYDDGRRAWYQTFDYDRYGNRGINVANTSDNADESNNALQLADFSGANNRITRAGYAYDSSGNLIAEPRKSYAFDAENRLVTATVEGAGTSQYVYDGNSHRVKKIVGGVATRFEYGAGGELIAERNDSNSVVTKDYFYNGGLLATTKTGTNGEYEYATADQLGTPRAWTDNSGNLVPGGLHAYMPFGEELFAGYGTRTTAQGYPANTQQDGQRKQFSSKERDAETGLDYFLARHYSSAHGRFLSPDEFTGGPDELYDFTDDASNNPTFYADLMDPQSLNKYQYCYNNPLTTVDPDGHKGWKELARQALDVATDFTGGVAKGIVASVSYGTFPGSGPSSDDSGVNRAGQVLGTAIVGGAGTTSIGAGGGMVIATGGVALLTGAPELLVGGGLVLTGGAIKNGVAMANTPIKSDANNQQSGGDYDRREYGSNPTRNPAAESIRREGNGQPCPRCGKIQKRDGPQADRPSAPHNPSLKDHWENHGGKDMTRAERKAYTRQRSSYEKKSICVSCNSSEGANPPKRLKQE
jgi:RHS repeat-associated protein